MKKATTIFTAMLMAATAIAQTPTLIKDINNGCGNHRVSNYFAPLKDGRVFFPLCANSTDAYAYATDGTAAGTTQINVPDLELNEGIVNCNSKFMTLPLEKCFSQAEAPVLQTPI